MYIMTLEIGNNLSFSRVSMNSFDGDPSPPLSSTLVDTDVIHVINYTRPSPSVFAYCK